MLNMIIGEASVVPREARRVHAGHRGGAQGQLPYYNVLEYTMIYCTILYCTILYFTMIYYIILYYTILYYSSTILYYTII